MARSKKVEIWMQVGNGEQKFLETCRDMDSAILKVERYQHEDQRERQDGYKVPDIIYIMKRKGE